MMISPQYFAIQHEKDSLKDLIKERDSLMREIKKLEKIVYDRNGQEAAWLMSPDPDVRYQMNLEYLAEICKLMSRKFNAEIVWAEKAAAEEDDDETVEEAGTLKEIIRDVMTDRGLTNALLAEKCGYNTPSGVSNILGRDSGI